MDPRLEYATRKRSRADVVATADARFGTVSNLRVLVAVLIVVSGWWSLAHDHGVIYALPFALAFVVLVIVHGRIVARRDEQQRAVTYYEAAEKRLAGKWIGSGDQGTAHVPAGHPYAFDVDAFGPGSLFELLSEPRTESGDRTLADWMLQAASVEEIRARQQAVTELKAEVELRELLALRAAVSRRELHLDDLRAWIAREPMLQSASYRWAVRLLGAGTFLAAIAWLGFGLSPAPFVLFAGLGSLAARAIHAEVRTVTEQLEKTRQELHALEHVLSCFEGRRATAPWLVARYAEFSGARKILGRLIGLVDWLEARRHQLFAPIAYLVAWTPIFAFAIEDWRIAHGRDVLAWLRDAGELEAICTLSRHAFEHPLDVVPELVDGEDPQLVAEALRHPLMAEEQCVPNCISLVAPLRLYLVSGSNMSGKSTLLRTVGLNVVLALMGAPVKAQRLALTPMQIAATLRVQDSLHEGASRFYAEIARLKVVADCAVAGPTLFLLDEILSGTNSHDRRIGSEAVVRSLLARNAIGFVTTHDLALTDVAATLGGQATNVHFEDEHAGTTLTFDYKMRPGVVQKSNAIELMRAVGLEV